MPVQVLTLANGTEINPLNGEVVGEEVEEEVVEVEVPDTTDFNREIVVTRKRINDLPVPPAQMNTLSVIIAYSIFGIADEDISTVLLIPLDVLQSIKQSDSYIELQGQFVQNIVESDSSNVRSMFVEQSANAAKVVFKLMNSKNESTKLSASKDVLDRAGQRPVDVIEHRHKLEGGLTIEYVQRDKENEIPVIETDYKEL